MSRVKSWLIKIYKIKNLIKKDFSSSIRVPFGLRLKCNLNGFLAESGIIYDFKINRHKNYLSDYARFTKTSLINSRFSYLLDNKFLFNLYFNKESIIKGVGLITLGLLYKDNQILDAYQVIQGLEEGTRWVLKPLGGGGGFGILFLEKKDNSTVVLNNNIVAFEKLQNILSNPKGYMVYNHFQQKGFSNELYPKSLNTIRVITMIDPKTGQPFIPFAVHRMGANNSGNVDNWSNGGLSAGIDVEKGVLSKAVGYPKSGKLVWYSVHPQSGVKIEGETVPYWEKIKEIALSAAKKVSMLPYIGWDMVLSDDEVLILEANSNSDVNLLQVHKPLLNDSRVREFFKYHKVI